MAGRSAGSILSCQTRTGKAARQLTTRLRDCRRSIAPAASLWRTLGAALARSHRLCGHDGDVEQRLRRACLAVPRLLDRGVSHRQAFRPLCLFDPKEFIREKHGQAIESPLRKEVTQDGTEKFLALAEAAPVMPRGQSGMMISDLLPHLSSVTDDICMLRGMSAGNPPMRLPLNRCARLGSERDSGMNCLISAIVFVNRVRKTGENLLRNFLPNTLPSGGATRAHEWATCSLSYS